MSEASFIMSTVALALYSLSYFFNSKKGYLALQLSGNVFLSASYLLIGSYFTTVAVLLGIVRGLICYYFERRDRRVPVGYIVGLCLATIASYVIINAVLLSQACFWDFLYLFSSCMYAVTFAIRNIRVMRYVVLLPHASAVAYNLLIFAPISSTLSYGIEAAVTLAAIVRYEVKRVRDKKRAH